MLGSKSFLWIGRKDGRTEEPIVRFLIEIMFSKVVLPSLWYDIIVFFFNVFVQIIKWISKFIDEKRCSYLYRKGKKTTIPIWASWLPVSLRKHQNESKSAILIEIQIDRLCVTTVFMSIYLPIYPSKVVNGQMLT